MQLVLHAEQTGGLLLGELEHRDTGPVGEYLGDLLVVDLGHHIQITGTPLLFALGTLGDQLLFLIAQPRRLLEVLRVDGAFLLPARIGDLVVEFAQVRRGGHATDAHARTGLVDQVDRLVRQEPVVDVAVGQRRGGNQGAIGDGDPVVRLVAVAQTLEDVDGVLDRRLTDLHRLEPALQGGILLDVLAVLVEGGRTDGLQFAAGQLRLQDGRRVDRALGGTRADERVQLVDEQDDVAAGVDLLEHLLQALFEVTAVAAARDQGTQVEGVELLILQRLRDLTVDNGLREAFDHGGLTDTGFADEDRVVLGAPAQHLHDTLDFLRAADDRVEFALQGGLGQVATELVEHQRGGWGPGLAARTGFHRLLALVAGQQLDDLLTHPVEIRTQLHQHLRRDTLTLTDQAEQNVLGADVVVAELQRLAQAQFQHLLGPRGERDVTGRGLLALPDDLLNLAAHALQRNTKGFQRLGRYALALVDQPKQDVLGADVVVVEHPGLFLGQDNDAPRAVGEPLEHRSLTLLLRHSGVRRFSGVSLPLSPGVAAPASTLVGRGLRRLQSTLLGTGDNTVIHS